MVTIVSKEDPVLREIARELSLKEITSPKTQCILENMKEALASQEDGVAIAAPQIGESLAIFVVSQKVFIMTSENPEEKKYTDAVFINPKIIKLSKQTKLLEEGCLSVRYLYGKVRRSHKVLIEAYDEHGKKRTHGATGILAQIFQHEIDHINGVLFIDKATDIADLPPVT